ncbi:hypothetical protein NE852_23545 [Rhizobium sp. Pop5]|uniref:hypothetical protein n=1 Tax=Rhizobium sp. Pop5 TaxID=1223565 RepID=UPI002158703D|nr:hypothetical protein [Rhizobium sp. Pop5]UVD56980.1 hypothetical protein NE852_23545 [Rhizobium sp. Pop5]
MPTAMTDATFMNAIGLRGDGNTMHLLELDLRIVFARSPRQFDTDNATADRPERQTS